MRALRSFTVRPTLPAALAPLERLAANLRWSWDERTRELFRWVDPATWDATSHDPVRLLASVKPERLEALAADPNFMRYLAEIESDLERYLTEPRWFSKKSPLKAVAYFSPEFGISEALPQYSGGLGILAGDHLKAASDLGVPVIGIGLFYRHGYFRQSLSLDGWQQERFPDLDPYAMALTLCQGIKIRVYLAGTPLYAQVWRADVGRTPLYLLDADIDDNAPAERDVTDRLYGGDTEHRIRQEILLGMGGVQALDALGIEPQVFHTNEGHAGFLSLERIRGLIARDGLSFPEAIEAVRAGGIFTTHTPVPAGIDRFPHELIAKYFSQWANDCKITLEQLYELGRRDDTPTEDRFNMAVMGLRLAGRSNGVAKLHGEVSREMFAGLWPDVPTNETPIGSITNGVHAPTWVSSEISDLLSRSVLPEWEGASASDWVRVKDIRDDELWRARRQGRERLVSFLRQGLRSSLERRGLSSSDAAWADEVLDPRALTIGFARRFATYKRANLLLSQPERLRALLLSADRPVQFVFAGKAHPADDPGKGLIQEVAQFASDPTVRHRFVFLDDYDISVARAFYHGADVWLNTPRRPLEACGTSGMKSALNGGLNCSILDGWWDECFDGTNGWAISSNEGERDIAKRDLLEANSLFELLEHQIVPQFYDTSEGGVPRRWLARVKSNFVTLGPYVNASRMVRDYATILYEPAAVSADAVSIDSYQPARDLAAWKQRVKAQWPGVAVLEVLGNETEVELGGTREISALLSLGSLEPGDVVVQLVHGPVGEGDELLDPTVEPMTLEATRSGGDVSYRGAFSCANAGRYGYTVRVLPCHAGLVSPVELGRIAWA
ncbi:MAG: alpha-glucan phosphorylase [Acidimicrobiia bacterium]|nr:alpha-glucan phosphorylase [Acidimicrobiia bacterium]